MSEPWFVEGLRFGCRRCGTCCTGEPGFVFVTAGEEEAAAGFLGIDPGEFRARYTRPAGGRTSLKEKAGGDCVFHSAEGCRIYRVRPVQCRTFPFWLRIVRRRAAWEEAGRECPGIGSGRLYRPDEIAGFVARSLEGRRKRKG